MRGSPTSVSRRGFIKDTAIVTTALTGFSLLPANCWSKDIADEGINLIGPKEGFSPQVGTLVSMMNWMRQISLRPVQKMTVEQLDYLHDSKSNTIGAMLLHLAATEHYYQLNTFEGKKWNSWDESIKKQWNIPMNLGEEARKTIKNQPLNYYLDTLKEVREITIQKFKERDDKWLFTVDKEWFWGATNNYCKWFHVCEHESNHNGQIKWIKSRLPGANSSRD